MRPSETFTVVNVDEHTGKCTLAVHGKPVINALAGAVIDGQYECAQSRYLLCLSFGTVWDDALNVYLVDADGAVLDAITGGGLMSSGAFKARNCDDNALDFSFFSDETISRVTVSPTPALHFLLPAPWRYRRLLPMHHLSLTDVAPGVARV